MTTTPRIYDYDPRAVYRRYIERDLAGARATRAAGNSPAHFLERIKHWRGGIADWNEDFKAGRSILITDLANPTAIGDYTLKADVREAA